MSDTLKSQALEEAPLHNQVIKLFGDYLDLCIEDQEDSEQVYESLVESTVELLSTSETPKILDNLMGNIIDSNAGKVIAINTMREGRYTQIERKFLHDIVEGLRNRNTDLQAAIDEKGEEIDTLSSRVRSHAQEVNV